MSPIDDELRTTLRRRAEGLPPPADPLVGIERRAGQMRRRRAAGGVAGTVLVAAAVAVALPLSSAAPHRATPTGEHASAVPSMAVDIPQTPEPRSGITLADPRELKNFINWLPRGSGEPTENLDEQVGRLWAQRHRIQPDQAAIGALWESRLPDGSRAGIWQFWELGTTTGYTVIGQRLTNGKVVLISDVVSLMNVGEISAVLIGPHFGFVLVLGPPQTGQIRYAAGGLHFAPVDRQPGYIGGPGWAVFDWPGYGGYGPATGPTGQPDRIELWGANGRPTYIGPIDGLGPIAIAGK